MNDYICHPEGLQRLFEVLKNRGYLLHGPTVNEDAIVYDRIESLSDLPKGYYDTQKPGEYRLKKGDSPRVFGYHTSPQSWKRFLFPSQETLWRARKTAGVFQGFEEATIPEEKWAFIGVLACDLQSISVLEKVFNPRLEVYKQFHQRRKNTFILALNCTNVVSTCFCASMGSGPDAKGRFDWAVTEIDEDGSHYFLVTFGSKFGEELIRALKLKKASEAESETGCHAIDSAARSMERWVDNPNVKGKLATSYERKEWDDVAKRCINCANCTMACPTCFCTTVVDHVNLKKTEVERKQHWESCFNLSHAYVHGGNMRASDKARYRQWLTHKFGTWWDQFGSSGCVGCGRCITWCPVGIDVTEELHRLDETKETGEKKC